MDASLSTGNFSCEPDNGTSQNIFFQSTGTAYVQAHLQNGCGWSDWSAGVPITVNSGYHFMISPNPTSGQVAVTQKDKATAEIAEIKIFDNTGNLKQQAKYTRGTKQAQLNTFGLKSGIYFIEISSGQYKERQQLVIQK